MAKIGHFVAELIESGAVRRIETPQIKLPLSNVAKQRLSNKPIMEFDVFDFAEIVNAHAAQDRRTARQLRLLAGVKGKLIPTVLSKMPGYGDVFTKSGALNQGHAERMFIGTDLSGLMDFFTKRLN